MSQASNDSGGTFVQLMGGFGLFHDGRPLDVPDPSGRLVAYLALGERARERSLVAAALWPDKSDARASANLRSSLWRLDLPPGVTLIRRSGSTIELDQSVRVDARDLQQVGWDLVHDAGPRAPELDRHALGADLLPGWYDDWVIVERERLTQLQLHFMEALAYALARAGELTDALDVAVRLVAADPLREGSQRALLWIYCSEGSLGQARRQLERYRTSLRDEFGTEPAVTLPDVMAEVERASACDARGAHRRPAFAAGG